MWGDLCIDPMNRDVEALRRDLTSLSKRIEALEEQHRGSFCELKNGIRENNSELISLRNELETVKSQQCDISKDLLDKLQAQQKSLADSKELEQIQIKYGNNPGGIPALHYAIKQGDVNAVNLLLTYGADANTKDLNQQHTALTLASSCNQYDIARILIDFGANVNLTPNKSGYYPIYYAAESGSGDLITLLLQSGAKLDCVNDSAPSRYPINPLHIACAAGNFDAIKALIDHRARIDGFIDWKIKEPDYLDWKEGTPLDWAVAKLTYKANPQNLDIIKYLVENGATRRVTNLYQHGARFYEYCPIIAEFLNSVGLFGY